MKIRSMAFGDLRAFRGDREIPFTDELTNDPRPLTVIVGSNGTGKTTILEAIHDVVFVLSGIGRPPWLFDKDADILGELRYAPTSFISGTFQLDQREAEGKEFSSGNFTALATVGGRIPEVVFSDGADVYDLTGLRPGSNDGVRKVKCLRDSASRQISEGQFGGLIFFPHERFLRIPTSRPIEPPPFEGSYVFRFTPNDKWEGSLEQLWVWQNYLDLEAGKADRSNLGRFVEIVEDLLGEGRKIEIKKGRVRVAPKWAVEHCVNERVTIDQLPSGERQVLLLFGELSRRLRRGMIVLIDEPEISLHPTLQRLVVHKLRSLARELDLQVILATHSLEIVHAASPSEVVNLDLLPERSEVPKQETPEAAIA